MQDDWLELLENGHEYDDPFDEERAEWPALADALEEHYASE